MWDDNWNRRVYAFSKDWKHRWIRNSRPIIVEPVDSFLGHFYGHQFIKDEKGHTYVFYEKVDQLNEQGDFPLKTEIFARKMISPFQSSNDEITILTLGDPIYPSAKRKDDALIEGPRPFKAVIHGKTFYFIGFSSGQYTLNTYGINLAVSKNLLGPYRTYLKADSSDLMDLGINLRKQYQFGQGPGRPAFFQDPQKKWWVLFHASEPSSHDIRHIFLAPVSFAIGQNGIPSVTISDGNLGGAEPFSSGTTLSKTR
jgi:beta-xylosidase